MPEPVIASVTVSDRGRVAAQAAFGLCVGIDALWLFVGPVDGWWRWGALAVVVAVHLACVGLLRRAADAVAPRTVLVVVAALAAVAVALPPRASKDVFLYAMEGRLLGVHHVNPYTHAPVDFASDPMFLHVARQWRTTIGAYGPAFQALAALGSLGYGTSALLGRLYFQVLAALALLGSVMVLQRRRVATWLLVLVGLAPAALATVNEAHIDVLVAFGLLVGVVMVLDGRYRTAGLVLGLAVLFKVNAAPPAVGVVVALLLARRWISARRTALVTVVVVVAGYVAFGVVAALGPLRQQSKSISRGSVPAWLSMVSDRLGRAAPAVATNPGLRSALAAATAAVALAALVHRWRWKPDVAEFALAFGLIYILSANYVLGWYPVALLPLLGLVRPRLAAIGLATVVGFEALYAVPAAALSKVPHSLAPARIAPFVALALLVLLVTTRPPTLGLQPSNSVSPALPGDGKLEPHHRTAAGVALGPDPAAVALHDLADDGQPQP